ncbi:hypothetical protein QYE76_048053 [Lolium multiflorum]|uniref:Uncharacterized protein n=1 Tax=Lolium multiflorum TaxID=4521 RepID=A0AAD8TR15_LOLMU|nr:hypothetical protein QYE76_048053 [Lolium multiflorum]
MGKKKGTTGSSASAGATKIGLDWCASTISNREVNRLRTLGFIPSADSDIRLLIKAKESNPSTAELTPPPRDVVAKVPLSKVNPYAGASTPSTARDHPILSTVDAVADFADQFTRLESENVQLCKAIKTSAIQVLEANRFTSEAENENTLLKDELKKLKNKMKDEQEARREAAIVADEKEGAL